MSRLCFDVVSILCVVVACTCSCVLCCYALLCVLCDRCLCACAGARARVRVRVLRARCALNAHRVRFDWHDRCSVMRFVVAVGD